MQKALSTVASLGAIILFVAVAASSKVTMVVLSVYGAAFLYFGVPVLAFAFTRRKTLAGFPVPKSLRAMMTGYIVAGPLAGIYSIAFSPEHEWTREKLTSFGLPQAVGLLGLAFTIMIALVVAVDLRSFSYRECPHCLSRIRREATRCRYCSGEVGATPKVIEQANPPQRTATGIGRWTPRHAQPGRKKKDFGQLSAPRVGSTMTRARPSRRAGG
jgi:hypothetical protein